MLDWFMINYGSSILVTDPYVFMMGNYIWGGGRTGYMIGCGLGG
jgi:hypothetical protein